MQSKVCKAKRSYTFSEKMMLAKEQEGEENVFAIDPRKIFFFYQVTYLGSRKKCYISLFKNGGGLQKKNTVPSHCVRVYIKGWTRYNIPFRIKS